jgi:protein required for attachment to host cells
MNLNALVLVADSARARLFRVVETDSPRAPIVLKEMESLVHPQARIKEGERHSDASLSISHSGKGGGHTVDDHRAAHDREEWRRFAKDIAHAVARTVKEQSRNPLITVTTHAVHALLADELARQLPKEAYVRAEIGELSELTPTELLEELERRGVFKP